MRSRASPVILPEAFEHGGLVVGLATTLGFVVAFAIAISSREAELRPMGRRVRPNHWDPCPSAHQERAVTMIRNERRAVIHHRHSHQPAHRTDREGMSRPQCRALTHTVTCCVRGLTVFLRLHGEGPGRDRGALKRLSTSSPQPHQRRGALLPREAPRTGYRSNPFRWWIGTCPGRSSPAR